LAACVSRRRLQTRTAGPLRSTSESPSVSGAASSFGRLAAKRRANAMRVITIATPSRRCATDDAKAAVTDSSTNGAGRAFAATVAPSRAQSLDSEAGSRRGDASIDSWASTTWRVMRPSPHRCTAVPVSWSSPGKEWCRPHTTPRSRLDCELSRALLNRLTRASLAMRRARSRHYRRSRSRLLEVSGPVPDAYSRSPAASEGRSPVLPGLSGAPSAPPAEAARLPLLVLHRGEQTPAGVGAERLAAPTPRRGCLLLGTRRAVQRRSGFACDSGPAPKSFGFNAWAGVSPKPMCLPKTAIARA
jgi:hypothetical protein